MGRTVTGVFVVVCDSVQEYAEAAAQIAAYEADDANPPLTLKELDEPNLTLRYTVTTTS